MYLNWLTEGQKPTDTIKEVVSESEDFDATLLGVDREGDVITCRVQVTPRTDLRGLLYGDVRFFSYHPGHSQPLTVVGRVGDRELSARP